MRAPNVCDHTHLKVAPELELSSDGCSGVLLFRLGWPLYSASNGQRFAERRRPEEEELSEEGTLGSGPAAHRSLSMAAAVVAS